MALCECEYPKQVEEIGYWDGCPLEGGGHTSFAVERCKKCGGIEGFPHMNLEIALKDGTPATKAKLAEIINENEPDIGFRPACLECGTPHDNRALASNCCT